MFTTYDTQHDFATKTDREMMMTDNIYTYAPLIGQLCGIDGAYLPAGYEGFVPETFMEMWGSVLQAFG